MSALPPCALVFSMPHLLWRVLQYVDPASVVVTLPAVSTSMNKGCKVALGWFAIVDFSGVQRLTVASLLNIVGGSTSLRILKLPSSQLIDFSSPSFKSLALACPHLRHVFICGSPYALSTGPLSPGWDRFDRDALEVSGFATHFRRVAVCPRSPAVLLASSRLLHVCRAMVLNDFALQGNAWLLAVAVIGAAGGDLEPFRIETIVVCSLYAVSKLCGYFLHFNDIIREVTHGIRWDAAFITGLQEAHDSAPVPLGSPVHKAGASPWDGVTPSLSVAQWNYVLHCTPMTWEFGDAMAALLPGAYGGEDVSPAASDPQSSPLLPARDPPPLQRSDSVLQTNSLLAVSSNEPTPTGPAPAPFASPPAAYGEPGRGDSGRVRATPRPPPRRPSAKATDTPPRDANAVSSPIIAALSLATPAHELEGQDAQMSYKKELSGARYRTRVSRQREMNLQVRLQSRERSLSPPQDPGESSVTPSESDPSGPSPRDDPGNISAGFIAPRVRRRSARITNTPFHPQELVVVTDGPMMADLGEDEAAAAPFHVPPVVRQLSAPAATGLFAAGLSPTNKYPRPARLSTPRAGLEALPCVREASVDSGESGGGSSNPTASSADAASEADPSALTRAASADAAAEKGPPAGVTRSWSQGAQAEKGVRAFEATVFPPPPPVASLSRQFSLMALPSPDSVHPPTPPTFALMSPPPIRTGLTRQSSGMWDANEPPPPPLPNLRRQLTAVTERDSTVSLDGSACDSSPVASSPDVTPLPPPPPPRSGLLRRQDTDTAVGNLVLPPPPPPPRPGLLKRQDTETEGGEGPPPPRAPTLMRQDTGTDSGDVSPVYVPGPTATRGLRRDAPPPVNPNLLKCDSGSVTGGPPAADPILDMIAFYNHIFVPNTRRLLVLLTDLTQAGFMKPE